MDCKTTSTRPAPASAFTLIELAVASAMGLLAALVIVMVSLYSSRSFAAIANYVNMDERSQLALDKMSREIREAHRLTAYSPTSLTFTDKDNQPLQFVYDANGRSLLRVSNGATNSLLTDCDFLQFTNHQRTVISNTFDAYAPAHVADSKLIQVTWTCSRKIFGAKANTESVQSAKIAIRNH